MLKKWSAFLGSFICIYIFCYSVLPFLDEVLGFKEAHYKLAEEDIESGAWYYIFVKKVEPSSENVRHTLKYSNKGVKKDVKP
ncbi:hypothetical protein H5J22_05215 [Cetobacterium sp. 8H]|uniref:hypothetical protein n=1 Tax=Cetobacterium sp. 8H TaxID=2759681 RepID=UPI00163C1B3B|nr:hypothetical protein [Cetobacterium sp. 8H]MBC2850834.1 hypothetical protein [Cetobacterium sp. 8H]